MPIDLETVYKASDAAHRRVDDLDKRVAVLETRFDNQDKKLDELSKELKHVSEKLNKHMIIGGTSGGGVGVIAYLLTQLFSGGAM